MTALTTPPATVALASPRISTALMLTGAVLAGNGLVLGSRLLLDPRDYSQVAVGHLHMAHYVVWTLCAVALSQLYPRLDAWRGRGGASLPVSVLALAGAGAALDACARFVSAFVAPYLAARSPALIDNAPDPVLLVPLLATGVVAMVGTTTLGVSAWRRRVFPRPAVVLLVMGAVAIPVLGPVSNVLLGLALAWIGASGRVRR